MKKPVCEIYEVCSLPEEKQTKLHMRRYHSDIAITFDNRLPSQPKIVVHRDPGHNMYYPCTHTSCSHLSILSSDPAEHYKMCPHVNQQPSRPKSNRKRVHPYHIPLSEQATATSSATSMSSSLSTLAPIIELMTDSLREHQATSKNLITAINNLTTAISTHMDIPHALRKRLHDEDSSSKAILGAIDTCVAGHVQDINSRATANHAHLTTQALHIQEQASDILHVMEDIKSTSEETVRTLSAIPLNLPSCSEYKQSVSLAHIHCTQTKLFGHLSPILPTGGSGTTSIDSSKLPKDDDHMDRNKVAILCHQQEEFIMGEPSEPYIEHRKRTARALKTR